jgi:hypothetical protein
MQNVMRLEKPLALAASLLTAMAVRAETAAAVDQASGLIHLADKVHHPVQVFRAKSATQ